MCWTKKSYFIYESCKRKSTLVKNLLLELENELLYIYFPWKILLFMNTHRKHSLLFQDLPVGNNLHDHYGTPVVYSLNEPITITQDQYMSSDAILSYTMYGQGPLTVPIGKLTSSITEYKIDILFRKHPDRQNVLIKVAQDTQL